MEKVLSFIDGAYLRRTTVAFVTIGLLLIFQSHPILAQTAVASNSGPICAGGSVKLYETGGDAVSWRWSSSGTAVFNDRTLQNPTATGVTDGEVFTVRISDDDDDDDKDDDDGDDGDDDDDDDVVSATTVVKVFAAIPPRPGLVTGNETQCVNATGVVYSISPVATATSYLWEVPSGVVITSGQGTVSIIVTIGPTAPAEGTIRVYAINACGSSTPARSKDLSVTQLPAAAGSITGSSSFTPGATGVPYSVAQITLATSYAWRYSGTGVTINGNGSRSVTLAFATDATAGQLSVRGTSICGEGIASSLDLSSAAKTLTLSSVLLEGLYSGASTMRQARNATGPQYAAGVADHIIIELHDANNYSTVVWSLPDVPLSVSGTAEINIPAARSGSYYITVRHRNSIETTTAAPVSFAGSSISQSFGAPSAVFGGNLKRSSDGSYLVFGGDVNQDGIVDTGDMNLVDNASSAILTGYNAADVNGDGIVDTSDMNIVDNNSTAIVRIRIPN